MIKEVIQSDDGIKIFISGSIKKSTGNYGMVEVNYGIVKDLKEDEDIETSSNEIYEMVEKGLRKYIESLFITSKEFDSKSQEFNRQVIKEIDEF